MAEDVMTQGLRALPHDGHEDRLQRSESDISELKAQHAEMSANLKFLGTQVTEMGSRISDKIDAFAGHMIEKVQEEHQRLTSVKERVVEHDRSLKAIEDEKKRQAERWDTWKKLIVTGVTGAAAIGLKELVTYLIQH